MRTTVRPKIFPADELMVDKAKIKEEFMKSSLAFVSSKTKLANEQASNSMKVVVISKNHNRSSLQSDLLFSKRLRPL